MTHAHRVSLIHAIAVIAFECMLLPASSTHAQIACPSGAPLDGADPAVYGSWEGPWIFKAKDGTGAMVCLQKDPCTEAGQGGAIAHAVLLTKGNKAGHVMLMDEAGRATFWNPNDKVEQHVLDSSPWFTNTPSGANRLAVRT